MTAAALQQLAWHLPRSADQGISFEHGDLNDGRERALQELDVNRFMSAYNDLSFGWRACKTLAANRLPFPGVLEGDDHVLFDAYLHNCSTRYHNEDVVGALAITRKTMSKTRNVIDALLLDRDATAESVAEAVNIRPSIVMMYEKLFYNVLDRKKDAAFISSVVYPDGRSVEAHEGYIAAEGIGRLLKRAGFNNGVYDVLYLAGFASGLLQSLTGPDVAQRLEAMIHANGLILARNGWMNQQTNAGIQNAMRLLTAAKVGGSDEGPRSPFASLGGVLCAEIKRVKGDQHEAQLRMANSIKRGTIVVEG